MTTHESEAVCERVQSWPEELREDAAHMLLMMEREGEELYELSAGELTALDEGEASGVASQAEVDAVFGRAR